MYVFNKQKSHFFLTYILNFRYSLNGATSLIFLCPCCSHAASGLLPPPCKSRFVSVTRSVPPWPQLEWTTIIWYGLNDVNMLFFSGAACFIVGQWCPWPYMTYELSFFAEMWFLPWHLSRMSGNRISIHGTNQNDAQYWRVRSGEVVFYAIVHFIPLQLQLRAPLFAQNRFVMYITRLHRYVCYVCHALYI